MADAKNCMEHAQPHGFGIKEDKDESGINLYPIFWFDVINHGGMGVYVLFAFVVHQAQSG